MRDYDNIDIEITRNSDIDDLDGKTTRLCQDVYWDDEMTTQLDAYKEFLKKFLMIAGFSGFEKEWLFCEAVTGDEYEFLEQMLKGYRERGDLAEAQDKIVITYDGTDTGRHPDDWSYGPTTTGTPCDPHNYEQAVYVNAADRNT